MQLNLRKDPSNEILEITFKRYRNSCNNLLKKLKHKYEREQLAQNTKNSKLLWNTIKKITHLESNKTSNTELLNVKDTPINSVNHVNDFFASVGRNLANSILFDSPPSNPNSNLNNCQISSFVLLEADHQEVVSVLMGLRSESAPGWDNISTKFLKMSKDLVVPIICHLTNLCFREGVFPLPLKQSIVTPVFKGGKRDDVNNYRPISVLPTISKIIEKLINTRLLKFLNKFNILSDSQFGFRQGKSTEDAVLALTTRISDCLDSGKKCLTVFLDLKKAFDTISLPILLQK